MKTPKWPIFQQDRAVCEHFSLHSQLVYGHCSVCNGVFIELPDPNPLVERLAAVVLGSVCEESTKRNSTAVNLVESQ